ncbi:hypothetical protein QMZ05_22205 [Bradyrhizobium sp. INPA03-11B]|uniref:AbiU2 domain-containing protein n=1 Tax=Bradyrhizobium sp. INPA03-11B TaxID=418598 RepID=UPI00338DFF1C
MYETWPVQKRIDEARLIIRSLIDHVHYLLDLHENNAVAIYSDVLVKQITRDDTGAAFRVFQSAMHQFELVRLCALWDSAQADRQSIMTVVELVDNDDVILALAEETYAAYANLSTAVYHQDHETEEIRKLIADAISRSNAEFGDQQAWRAIDDLKNAIKATREFESSELMAALRNHRDKYLAHSLRSTRREKLGPIASLKYGNETAVLEKSLPIVEALYCWVNGTSISLAESQESDRKNAIALWGACRFEADVV